VQQFPTDAAVFEFGQDGEDLYFAAITQAEAIPDDIPGGYADVARERSAADVFSP
jgi:hypothetical protein